MTPALASSDSQTPDAPAVVPDAPAVAPAAAAVAPRPARRPKPRQLPPWNVVLLDDDEHTYQYVIEMLTSVFAHPAAKAQKMAEHVDARGRVVVFTAHRELAELKRDQILAYGADPRVSACRGSMSAVLEPAEPT